MSDHKHWDLKPNDAKMLDVAVDTRKFEIGLFWQRSLFFWGFIAAAFVAYAEISKDGAHDANVLLLITSFGFICSLAWTLANRGSKYWQNAWEAKVETIEGRALGKDIFSPEYTPLDGQLHWWSIWSKTQHYSVSKLAIALSDFTAVIWIVLFIKSIPAVTWTDSFNSGLTMFIVAGTAAYAVAMRLAGRSSNSR